MRIWLFKQKLKPSAPPVGWLEKAMQPGYTIDFDRDRRLLRLTLFGFWDAETLRRYEADVSRLSETAAKQPQLKRGVHVLIDMREHTLLAKDLAASLQDKLTQPHPNDRTAILVSRVGILKIQAKRVAAARRPQVFTSEAEALIWLFEEDGS